MSIDNVKWDITWGVHKFDEDATGWLTRKLGFEPVRADFLAANIEPYEIGVVPGNLLTTAGLTRITSLITAGGGVAFTNTTARIGTGNGGGTAAVGDTDLSPASHVSTNQWYNVLDATYPTVSAGVITAFSTFTSANGNYAWTEFAIDINTATVSSGATTAGILLNHKTGIAQGTKTAGQSWTAQATITFS